MAAAPTAVRNARPSRAEGIAGAAAGSTLVSIVLRRLGSRMVALATRRCLIGRDWGRSGGSASVLFRVRRVSFDADDDWLSGGVLLILMVDVDADEHGHAEFQ